MDQRDDGKGGFATRAIHHGYRPQDNCGALTPPIHVSSTYVFDSAGQGGALFAGEGQGYIYGRVGTPTQSLLEARLASLEGGEAALCTASGMGAIAATLWTLLKPGDQVVVDKTLYGCTFALLHHTLARFGVEITHADLTRPENLEAAMGPRARLVFFETPANPNMRLVDIAAVAEIAHARDVPVIVDNTYCTPRLQRPLELGADLVVHSMTKYLGGHGDLLAGAVIGPKETLDQVRMVGVKDATGAVISSFDAFLVLRGLKTLDVRMERHSANGLALARLLQAHAAVAAVHYPGLESFPQHALAGRQMALPGGIVAFELKGGMAAGLAVMDRLRLISRAVSLGDAESLVQHPASMTHSNYTPEERAIHGITDGLVRISVGLETLDDLLEDLEQALAAA